MARPFVPKNQLFQRSSWTLQDSIIILAIILLLFAIIKTASQFSGAYNPALAIQTSLNRLPGYTAQTLLRMSLAYFLSLGFTLIYAYAAYRSAIASRILLPLLDILQSIPVLSFLPGIVLAFITLFPGQQIGIEIASIVLMFTGMTWNMTFSFYQSLSTIPKELLEAAQIYQLNAWQRFWQLEFPSGVIGLVWNSVMSVAGGWFFLIAMESFTLGDRSFQLPGLGSFLAKAANDGDIKAMLWGLVVLLGIIIAIDFFVWRPLIAWAEKFKFETQEQIQEPQSTVLNGLRRSPTIQALHEKIWSPLGAQIDRNIIRAFPSRPQRPAVYRRLPWIRELFLSGFTFIMLWGTWEAALLLRTLNLAEWRQVVTGALFTALRVIVALLLSLLWTVPTGVVIGRNPHLAKALQPIVQIAASVPATALFPPLLLFLSHLGSGLEVGSILLMMMGTMWYILFNVIAGAQSIPSELFEAAKVYRLSRLQQWKTLILPGVFPYLVTGIITAVGGAWNASIVSEYIRFRGKTFSTPGLGTTISQASETGNFSLLLAATVVMSLLVVLTNRLVWRRLYQLAQEKYQLL